jgi:hypothetical protein
MKLLKLLKCVFAFIGIGVFSIYQVQSQIVNVTANTGFGTTNYVTKWITGSPTFRLGDSQIQDGGTNVGIGYAGSYKLDVNGNINAGGSSTTTTNGFYLGTSKILWHNGDVSSFYAGVGAGASITSTTLKNTFVGNNAGSGSNNTDGQLNTFIGYETGSLADNTSAVMYGNAAVGVYALQHTKAYGGCALGSSAGAANTTGCGIIAIGESAMSGNTLGDYNIAIGYDALAGNKTSSYNVAIGPQALSSQNWPNGTGDGVKYDGFNVGVGYKTLFTNNPTSTTTGISNTAIGTYALYSNTTGAYNTACGYQAGYSNISGSNVFIGNKSGYSNTVGTDNVFIGTQAGYTTSNTDNVIVGVSAGYYNTRPFQTYVGHLAGQNNSTGDYNTFIGYIAGQTNTTGSSNTFMGLDAGYTNSTGSYNSGLGLQVLGQTTASYNTALGYKAGYTNTSGTSNTYVGYQADASGVNPGTFTNSGAFGYNVTTTASNKFVIGNSTVTWVGTAGTSTWQTGSDGRFKTNVTENVKGLDFINRLRPVTYNMDTRALDEFVKSGRSQSIDSSGNSFSDPSMDYDESTAIVHSGFIAQEVEQAAINAEFVSSIVHTPSNQKDPYSLGYAEFVVPLVKAVQELSQQVQELQAQINSHHVSPTQNNEEEQNNNSGDSSQVHTTAIDVTLSSRTIVLNAAQPNPFKEMTTITFFIPENTKNVKIIFTDSQGNVMKAVAIPETGNGQLNVYAEDLSSGIYTYTLVANGVTIDSKKMVCNK